MTTKITKSKSIPSKTNADVLESNQKITMPQSSLDWQLALTDPLTKIGRDYFARLVDAFLDRQDILYFQQQLAYIKYIEQTRIKEQILREMEYDDERKREKILKTWATTQLKLTPVDDYPTSAKSLLREILELLLAASKLTVVYVDAIEQQKILNVAWDKFHQEKADKFFNTISSHKAILGKELVDLINLKKDMLTKILTHPHPDFLLKVNPPFAKKLHNLEETNPALMNELCMNAIQLNDAISELGFHANIVKGEEPLMGAALLDAMLAPKGPDGKRIKQEGRQAKFEKAKVTFQSTDLDKLALMFQEGASLYNIMQDASKGLDSIEGGIKERIQVLSNALHAIPRPTPAQRKLLKQLEEESERLQAASQSGSSLRSP